MKKIDSTRKRYGQIARLPALLMSFLLLGFVCSGDQAQAGTQSFETPKVNTIANINFENGGFEEPTHAEVTANPSAYGSAQYPVYLTNHWSIILHMNWVPGWNTIPTEAQHQNHAQAQYIEIEQTVPNSTYPEAQEGNQYAELNAMVPGTLYQVCKTNPGQKVYWEFYHRGRQGLDTMDFYLYNNETQTIANVNYIIRAADDETAWHYYSGAYSVPANQNWTTFAFQAVDAVGGNTMGNFLDAINFFNPSFLELTKTVTTPRSQSGTDYAVPGDRITYTVEIENVGEADTSRTVFRDVLPDGIDLDQSSIRMTYTDKDGNTQDVTAAGTVYYNSGNDELSIQAGQLIENAVMYDGDTGKEVSNTYANGTYSIESGDKLTITFDAVVTGNGVSAGDEVWNQMKVFYNDLGFEQYNRNGVGLIQDENNVSDIAIFEFWPLVKLEIEKELDEKAERPESFVFRVDYREEQSKPVSNTFYATVLITDGQDSGSTLLTDLNHGHYTVTELDSSWQYHIDLESNRQRQQKLDSKTLEWKALFNNKLDAANWINGRDYIENRLKPL